MQKGFKKLVFTAPTADTTSHVTVSKACVFLPSAYRTYFPNKRCDVYYNSKTNTYGIVDNPNGMYSVTVSGYSTTITASKVARLILKDYVGVKNVHLISWVTDGAVYFCANKSYVYGDIRGEDVCDL